MALCRSCNQPIMWVPLNGKQYPVNLPRQLGGNIEFDGTARIVDSDPTVARFVSHFATCPDAASWRRPPGHGQAVRVVNGPDWYVRAGR